ncbi:MAG: type II CRISPR RNA-guided endonuclease Cas9, partial [Cytophagales bacterium]
RVRNRFTYRSMYEQEFERIWETQQKHHPAVFSQQGLKAKIEDILFDQLPLVPVDRGKCTFENHKKYHKPRARRCDPLFEEFRMYQWVNNFMQTLKKERHATTDDTRRQVLDFYQKPTTKKLKKTIATLKEALGIDGPYTEDEETRTLPESPVTQSLHELFGKHAWESLEEKERRDRWHIIFQQHEFEFDKLKAYATRKWKLADKNLETLDKIRWGKETANISVRAIRYILPYLKEGHIYDKAVILGSIEKAFGHHWVALPQAERQCIINKAIEIIKSTSEKPIEAIKAYLRQQYPDKAYATDHIYHHADMKKVELQDRLTDFEPTRNPMVNRALYALRRHLNPIMEHHKIKSFAKIRVEMARELKKSEKERNDLMRQQGAQQQENQAACAWLLQNNHKNTGSENIKKYRLWQEAGFTCVYTGQRIGAKMFKDAEIEHIRPIKPQDSRWVNLTIASKQGNSEKGKRTPYEAFGSLPSRWEEIKKRAKKYFSPFKYQHFISTAPLEKTKQGFTQREANLTGYITKAALGYLKQISNDVESTQGGVVSQQRNAWRLNGLLSPALDVPKNIDETKLELGQYWVAYQEDTAFIPREPRVLPYRRVIDIEQFKPTAETEALAKEKSTIDEIKKLWEPKRELESRINALKDLLAPINAQLRQYKKHKKHLAKHKKKKQPMPLLFATDDITHITDAKALQAKIKSLEAEKKPYVTELKDKYTTLKSHNTTIQKGIKSLKEKQFEAFKKRVEQQLKDEKANNKKFHTIATELVAIKSKEGDVKRKKFIQKGKNRTDHRHHLIDACVIAATQQQSTQYVNRTSGAGEWTLQDAFPLPWDGFSDCVKEALCDVVISHRTKRELIEETQKWGLIPKYPTPGDRTPTKRYQHARVGGTTARTELYKATYYGRYTTKKDGKEYVHYVHRVDIDNIKTEKQAKKIVDETIRALVENRLEETKAYNAEVNNYNKQVTRDADKKAKKDPFWDIKKEGKEIVSKTPTLFYTKDGQYMPGAFPIKKVRIGEKFSNAVAPRLNEKTNRWVNPKNNWIAGIYQTPKGKWVNKIITALEAAHMKQKDNPCPPQQYTEEQPYPLVFTLQTNELVIFTTDFEGIDPRTLSMAELSPYIYRVQKISPKEKKNGEYNFRRHTATTLANKTEGRCLKLNPLQEAKPIKLKIDKVGNIKFTPPEKVDSK